MNLKNPRARYWVAGLAVLLAGVVVFSLLHFSGESVNIGNVPREELPKIQVRVQHWRLKKVIGALQTWEWRKLPGLIADCFGRSVAEVRLFRPDNIWAVTKRKNMDSHATCYFLKKS